MAIPTVDVPKWPTKQEVEKYSALTDSWSTLNAMPEKRSILAAASCGNSGYILAGLGEDWTASNILDSVHEYTLATDEWTRKNKYPKKVTAAAAVRPHFSDVIVITSSHAEYSGDRLGMGTSSSPSGAAPRIRKTKPVP